MKCIATVSFDYSDSNKFGLLHKVLLKSIKQNVPDVKIISYHLPEPEIKYNRTRSFISNSVKLEKWVEVIHKCADGDQVALMDCDMLVLNDFFDIFDGKFDIGYTIRTNSKWPLNGGVIFVRVNDGSRSFMKTLLKVNNEMLTNVLFHRTWQERYAGINQAALGYIIDNWRLLFRLKPFPCKIYNACGEDLPDLDENITKVIHVKGKLRQAIFGEIETEPELIKPVSLWNSYKKL